MYTYSDYFWIEDLCQEQAIIAQYYESFYASPEKAHSLSKAGTLQVRFFFYSSHNCIFCCGTLSLYAWNSGFFSYSSVDAFVSNSVQYLWQVAISERPVYQVYHPFTSSSISVKIWQYCSFVVRHADWYRRV